MSSQAIAKDISEREATDLLHQLITESTKVQAVSVGGGPVSAGVIGFVRPDPSGLVMIGEGKRVNEAFLIFNPFAATSFISAPALSTLPSMPDDPKPGSALHFIFPDGARVTLFEIPKS